MDSTRVMPLVDTMILANSCEGIFDIDWRLSSFDWMGWTVWPYLVGRLDGRQRCPRSDLWSVHAHRLGRPCPAPQARVTREGRTCRDHMAKRPTDQTAGRSFCPCRLTGQNIRQALSIFSISPFAQATASSMVGRTWSPPFWSLYVASQPSPFPILGGHS